MNTKRLLKLADHLETIPRRLFNMDFYGEERKCGTVACALGHAGFIPAFRRAGLKSKMGDEKEYDVWCGDSCGTDAAQVFFNIDRELAYALFMPDSYPESKATPKQVAKRIRRLCEQGKTKTASPA